MIRLEGKHLVLKLADRAGLLEAQTLGGLLQSTNHGRGATDKDLDIICRCRQESLRKVLVLPIPPWLG